MRINYYGCKIYGMGNFGVENIQGLKISGRYMSDMVNVSGGKSPSEKCTGGNFPIIATTMSLMIPIMKEVGYSKSFHGLHKP